MGTAISQRALSLGYDHLCPLRVEGAVSIFSKSKAREFFARRIFQATDFVQIIMVQLPPDRLEGSPQSRRSHYQPSFGSQGPDTAISTLKLWPCNRRHLWDFGKCGNKCAASN